MSKHPEIKLSKITFDFDPGLVPPQLLRLRVYERTAQERFALQGDCDIVWNPDESFHLLLCIAGKARQMPIQADNIGISAMTVKGTMSALLAPLVPYEPCVSTGQGFFLDAPEVHITLCGINALGTMGKVLTGMIENMINTTLADSFILPNRFVQRIEKNIPLETMVSMKSPLPLGVLRIEVFEGRNLPAADVSMWTGKRTSDPFVAIKIGHNAIRTSTISDSLDPVWDDPPGHLFVYNVDQLVRIEVHDDDLLSGSDSLGGVFGYNVFTICQEFGGGSDGGKWVDIRNEKGANSGRLRIR